MKKPSCDCINYFDKPLWTRHGLCYTSLYKKWASMLMRCENPKRDRYVCYGGRGISVCSEWHYPINFMDWALTNGYQEGLQIDRIDNDGNYCPTNCRWTTLQQNSYNRQNSRTLTINKETKCVTEWEKLSGISRYTIYWWIKKKSKEHAESRIATALQCGKPIVEQEGDTP